MSAAVILGLSAGFSPGPLLTLVISQALRYGIREGIKVAVSPLLTDLPVLLLSLFVLKRIEGFRTVLGAISLLGGCFVLKLAYESLRARRPDFTPQETEPQSLVKGAVVNALNPNPYVFWLTVGGPTFLKAWDVSPFTAVLFAAGFLGCLVGAKVCLAILAGRSRHVLGERTYRTFMRALAVFLAVFAFLLLKDGVLLLGVLSF